MKKTIKLIPAIVMLLVSAILVSTSTYAWFSMNTQVNVTGMTVKTSVQDNLLIAEATSGTEDNNGEAEGAYKRAITTQLKAILEPASTVNGVKYYYTPTDNVVGTGDARTDNYIAYESYDSETTYGKQAGDSGFTDKFSQNYGISSAKAGELMSGETKAVPYKDYAFYLKATNTATYAQNVNVTALTLTYGGSAQTQKAFRAAMFVDAMTDATSGAHASVADMTLVSIVKPSDNEDDNFTDYYAVSASGATAPTEISSSVRYKALTVGSVDAGTTKYFKVVIRLWLEGEDETCNNTTFATLNDKWNLDITCKMDGTAAVSAITQGVTATKIDLTSRPSAADNASTNKVIDNVTYYKIGDTSYYALSTGAVTTATRVFAITDNHPYDVTNQVKFGYTITIVNNSGAVTSVAPVVYDKIAGDTITATGITDAGQSVTVTTGTATVAVSDNTITLSAISSDVTLTIANK